MERKSYEQELSEVLAILASSLKGSSQDKKSLAQGWVMFLKGRVEQRWLVPTCEWFGVHATFFPTPAEFIEKAREIQERHSMRNLLESTKRALKESEDVAALDRRRRNIEAGIDPDELLPIDAVLPVLGSLTNRMLPEHIDEEDGA